MTQSVSGDEVKTMATMADLPLTEDRNELVAALLSAWLPAANELSRMMSAAEYADIMPITVLVHPQTGETRE